MVLQVVKMGGELGNLIKKVRKEEVDQRVSQKEAQEPWMSRLVQVKRKTLKEYFGI